LSTHIPSVSIPVETGFDRLDQKVAGDVDKDLCPALNGELLDLCANK
jgi:hypothetical protein